MMIEPGRGAEARDQFSQASADEEFELEAASGLEPEIEVLQTSALTTWLRRPERSTIEERRRSIKIRAGGDSPRDELAGAPGLTRHPGAS
jgi:hypothetical protein